MTDSIDLPKTQRAIVANDQLDYRVGDDVPLPPLNDDCVIIKTEYVGLKPVDTKMIGPFVGAGATYGVSAPRLTKHNTNTHQPIDCAGVVVAMRADIAASGRLKLGDCVAGRADGMEPL